MNEEYSYAPGRSLFIEMAELREQMTNLRAAMSQLVDLQREIHTKLDAALSEAAVIE